MERVLDAISHGRSKPADEVVILPVEEVVPSKLSRERGRTIRLAEICHELRSFPSHKPTIPRIRPSARKNAPFHACFASACIQQCLDPAQTQDGLHFSPATVKQQANILLNLRCNDALPNRVPFDKTCCRRYPWPVPMHLSSVCGDFVGSMGCVFLSATG